VRCFDPLWHHQVLRLSGRCSSQCRWSLRRLCADPGFSR